MAALLIGGFVNYKKLATWSDSPLIAIYAPALHFSPFSPISILTCLHRYRCKDLHSPIQQLHGYLLYDSSVIFSGETLLIRESEKQPPHKIDENLWKNREQIEEIIFLLETSNWPTSVCGYWEHFFWFLARVMLGVCFRWIWTMLSVPSPSWYLFAPLSDSFAYQMLVFPLSSAHSFSNSWRVNILNLFLFFLG